MSYSKPGFTKRTLVVLVSVAISVQPQLLIAAEQVANEADTRSRAHRVPSPPQQSSSDIVLAEGGVLVGRVVDAQGQPIPMAPVSLRTSGKEIARPHTDQDGRFKVSSLKGGIYEVVSPGHQDMYRFWAPRTAPPAAQQGITLVSHGDVIRGQYGPPSPGGMFSSMGQKIAEHPIFTAGLIATAVAIPLALDEDDGPPVEP